MKNKNILLLLVSGLIFTTSMSWGSELFNCNQLKKNVRKLDVALYKASKKRSFVCAAFDESLQKFSYPIAFLDSLNSTPLYPEHSDVNGKAYTCCPMHVAPVLNNGLFGTDY